MVSQIKVDSILETTSGNGVTVDGVLIKDGNVDGVDVSNTGLIHIHTATFSGATAVSVDDKLDASLYSGYKIIGENFRWSSDGRQLRWRFRKATNSDVLGTYTRQMAYEYTSNQSQGYSTTTDYGYLTSSHGQQSGEGMSWTADVVVQTNGFSYLTGMFLFKREDNLNISYRIMSGINTTDTINGFQFFPDANNFSGEIHLYGYTR